MIVPLSVLSFFLAFSANALPTQSEGTLSKRYYVKSHYDWECPQDWHKAPHPMMCDWSGPKTQQKVPLPAPTEKCKKPGYWWSEKAQECSKLRMTLGHKYFYYSPIDNAKLYVPIKYLDIDGDINREGWWIALNGITDASTHLGLGEDITKVFKDVFDGWLDQGWELTEDGKMSLDATEHVVDIVHNLANAHKESDGAVTRNASKLANSILDLNIISNMVKSILDPMYEKPLGRDFRNGKTIPGDVLDLVSQKEKDALIIANVFLRGDPLINLRTFINTVTPGLNKETVDNFVNIIKTGDIGHNIKLFAGLIVKTDLSLIKDETKIVNLGKDLKFLIDKIKPCENPALEAIKLIDASPNDFVTVLLPVVSVEAPKPADLAVETPKILAASPPTASTDATTTSVAATATVASATEATTEPVTETSSASETAPATDSLVDPVVTSSADAARTESATAEATAPASESSSPIEPTSTGSTEPASSTAPDAPTSSASETEATAASTLVPSDEPEKRDDEHRADPKQIIKDSQAPPNSLNQIDDPESTFPTTTDAATTAPTASSAESATSTPESATSLVKSESTPEPTGAFFLAEQNETELSKNGQEDIIPTPVRMIKYRRA